MIYTVEIIQEAHLAISTAEEEAGFLFMGFSFPELLAHS